jgi:hypothetical protein
LPHTVLREVSTGVTVDQMTEIKSGISLGEKVVIQGQQFVTDGVPVRAIGSAALPNGSAL